MWIPVLVVALLLAQPAAAAAEWLSLRSDHFEVVGNAAERELRAVALRFEQFRDVVRRLNPALLREESAPPVVVLVFRDGKSFAPFMPQIDGQTVPVSGYFQPGRDVNYITLSLEAGEDAYPAIFHEFTHLLVRGVFADAPLWFGEGLAEYYSTFEVTPDGRRATIGKPVARHVALLQQRRLPFQRFFTLDRTSREYTRDGSDRAVLYAQAWAILHHAFHGPSRRRDQLLAFVLRQAAGGETGKSFSESYGIEMRALEEEVQAHVQSREFRYDIYEFTDRITQSIRPTITRISDTDADARLGDLLVHMGRPDAAVALLERALAANPGSAVGHASLGTIRLREGRTAEALAHFKRAVEQQSVNEMVYFAYALGLLYEDAVDNAALVARALRRAIELRPGYTEAKLLLAQTYFITSDYALARDLLTPVVSREPTNHRAAIWLAEALLNLDDVDAARGVLTGVMARATDDSDRDRARLLLADADAQERGRTAGAAAGRAPGSGTPDDARPGSPSAPAGPERGAAGGLDFRPVASDEERAAGVLEAIECQGDAAVFVVRTADRTIRARATTMAGVEFIAYRELDNATVRCGPQSPALEVYLTWRKAGAAPPGEVAAVALEILPKGLAPR